MYEDFRIKVFKAVVECHSFTLASHKLGISQPAVSQNIAELERIGGAQLFTRSRNNVRLTDAGKVFSDLADKVDKAYDNLNAVFGDFQAFQDYLADFQKVKEDPRFDALKELCL